MDKETKLDAIELARGYAGVALLSILMATGIVTGLAVHPGETKIFSNDLGLDNLVYAIVNNNTNVGSMIIVINSSNITITFPEDMAPTSFDIVFIEEATREVVQVIHTGGGGGGSSTRYVDRNVTVVQPLFFDRNITKTIEKIVEVPSDEITIKETGIEVWKWLLIMVVGMIIIGIGSVAVYRKFWTDEY